MTTKTINRLKTIETWTVRILGPLVMAGLFALGMIAFAECLMELGGRAF